MSKPFRFGVSMTNAGSAQEWRDSARKAEDLGYDILHCADHLRGSFAPMLALSFAAEATKTIRVGTFVINNDFRHPVLIAREAATLDFLSGGRFEFGVGAGHAGEEYDEAGMPFDEPPVRVARLAEAVAVMKRLWSGEEASFEGEHFNVRGHKSHPAPVQQPIPLLIGGNGKNILRLAAREADIVGFTGIFLAENGVGVAFPHFTEAGLANRVDLVRETAGARFDGLELNVLVQGVETEKPREQAEQWANQLSLDPDELMSSPFTAFGEVDALVDKLYAQRERLGISYVSTHGHGIDKFAPIVARLSGK